MVRAPRFGLHGFTFEAFPKQWSWNPFHNTFGHPNFITPNPKTKTSTEGVVGWTRGRCCVMVMAAVTAAAIYRFSHFDCLQCFCPTIFLSFFLSVFLSTFLFSLYIYIYIYVYIRLYKMILSIYLYTVLSIYLSTCCFLSFYRPVHPSIHLSIHFLFYLSTYLSIHLSFYLSVDSINLSVHLRFWSFLATYPFFARSAFLCFSVCLSIHLSFYLLVFILLSFRYSVYLSLLVVVTFLYSFVFSNVYHKTSWPIYQLSRSLLPSDSCNMFVLSIFYLSKDILFFLF